jgi:DNA repair protein RadA/Sms
MTVDEPAADLAVVGAVASSLRVVRSPGHAVFSGIGLAGEVRSALRPAAPARDRHGSTRIVVPEGNIARDEAPAGCEIVPVKNVGDALDELLA